MSFFHHVTCSISSPGELHCFYVTEYINYPSLWFLFPHLKFSSVLPSRDRTLMVERSPPWGQIRGAGDWYISFFLIYGAGNWYISFFFFIFWFRAWWNCFCTSELIWKTESGSVSAMKMMINVSSISSRVMFSRTDCRVVTFDSWYIFTESVL